MLINCKFLRIAKINVATRKWHIRTLSAQAQAQLKVEQNADLEWENAKPYSSIPGPSKLGLLKLFMPGGKLHNSHFMDLYKFVNKEYGKISKLPGLFGKPDIVFTFQPSDMEILFRYEGQFPIRRTVETYEYYRKQVRPDVFKNLGGLVNDQGETWSKLRTALNPIMMKPNVVKAYIPGIDKVAADFVQKIKTLRDDNNEMPDNFQNELNMWSLESIALVALEQRLGLITNSEDPDNKKLIKAKKELFYLSYQLDVEPSIWKYYKTPKFNRLMAAFDVMTNISKKRIDIAIDKLKKETEKRQDHEESVLQKVLQIDEHYAFIMALDMLLAGIDTTASAVAGLLFNLANNQAAQDKLREEIISLFPNKDVPLTPDSLQNLPYMRACIKESIRILPIFTANIRGAARDLLLQGYQIPKGTTCVMAFATSVKSEEFVERAAEFIPERFLKEVPSGCPNGKDINPFLMLPFGFGARACIGKRFAEMEIEVLLIRLLREFKIEWKYGPLKFANGVILTPASQLKYKITNL